MATFSEYTNSKKKKKNLTGTSFSEYTKNALNLSDDEIAPVVTVNSKPLDYRDALIEEKSKNRKTKKDDDRTWFQKSSVFDDGYQFGDIAKAILGTGTDVEEHLATGVLDMGETTFDALVSLSSGAYLSNKVHVGFNLSDADFELERKLRENSKEFIKKDLYDSEKIAKQLITEPRESTFGIDVETTSVLGEKSDSLVESAGQLGATALISPFVPWYLTSGLTSYGGEMENALNEGATMEEAMGSALISAGAEVLSEKISGGISFGGKTLDAGLTDVLARNISSKGLRVMSKLGMDMAGEGAEEVFSSAMSRLGTKLYKEESLEELLASEEAFDEYLESFIGGSVLGGVSSGVDAAKSSKQGTDVLTGYTKNEQAVFDKVVENRIKEQEQDGKTLTSKDKKKIYEQVERELERGEIDLDTIERTLGEESYKEYDNLVKESEEFETLRNTKFGELTDVQSDRLAELKKKNEAKSYNELLAESKQKISQDVFKATENDRFVRESYYETSKRGHDFEADLSQYDEKQRVTVQKAIDSGYLNNTRKTHELVDMIAKVSAEKNVSFDFMNNQKLKESGFAVEGYTVNGFKQGDNITVNVQSNKVLETVVGHEITHVLEGSKDFYDAFASTVKEFAEAKGIYQEMYDAAYEGYKGVYTEMTEEEYAKAIEKEVTADLVGDYIFSDIDFVRNLSMNRNVFQKVYDEIKYFLKSATTGSEAERKLLKAKKLFEEVYRDGKPNTTESEDVQFSIRKEAPPENTKKAYKLMRYVNGKYYPLFIGNNEAIEQGVWYNADSPNLDMLKTLPEGTHMVNMESGEAVTFEQYLEEKNLNI